MNKMKGVPLDPGAAALLERLPQRRPVHRLTPSEARADMAAAIAAASRPVPAVAAVDDGTIRVGGADLRVRSYRPLGASSAVTMYLHGGGWVTGDLESHDGLCRAWANATRCEVVAIEYRLAPEHPFPVALDDAYGALEWLAARGRPIVVAGDSAGATLATVVAQLSRDRDGPPIAGQVLLYPPVRYCTDVNAYAPDLETPTLTGAAMAWYWHHYVANPATGMSPRCSPLHADVTGLPPARIVRAGVDVLAPEVDEYANRLTTAGVAVEAVTCAGAFHGFVSFVGMLPAADNALAAIAVWYSKNLAIS